MSTNPTIDPEGFGIRLIIAEHVRDTALGLMTPQQIAHLAAKLPRLYGIGTGLHPTVEIPERYRSSIEIIVSGLERQLTLFEGDLSAPTQHRYVCLKCGWTIDNPVQAGINCAFCGTNEFCTWLPAPINRT